VVVASACSNFWNRRGSALGAIPIPVSCTEKRIMCWTPGALVFGRRSTRRVTVPLGVNLKALPTRLISTWRRRVGSPTTKRGRSVVEVDRKADAVRAGLFREQPDHVADGRIEREVDVLDGELAGLDLREVEQVVDDRQQRLGIRLAAQDLFARASRRPPSRSAKPSMPITPASGVRISWLMLARNSDFWRAASSARCLASCRRCSFSYRARLARPVRPCCGAPRARARAVRRSGARAGCSAAAISLGARADLVLEALLLARQAAHAQRVAAVAEPPTSSAAAPRNHQVPQYRRLDGDVERGRGLAPDPVLVGGAHLEHVAARIEVGVGGEALAGVGDDPVLVEALELVGEAVALAAPRSAGPRIRARTPNAGRTA
jgi:hypothetical protein